MADAPKRHLPLAGGGSSRSSQVNAPGAKRRLPVLQGNSDEEDAEERPPWHWVALGTVAMFIVWLPLAGLANTVLRQMLERAGDAELPASMRAAMVGFNSVAFVVAGAAAGFLVGRFGGRAGRREAAASGVVVAVIAWMLALAQGASAGVLGWILLLVVMIALGGSASYGGGVAGLRARVSAEPRFK